MKRISRGLIAIFIIMFLGLGIQINFQGGILIEMSNKTYAADSGPVIGTVTTSSTTNSISISGIATSGSSILDSNPYRFSVGTNTSGWIPANYSTGISTIDNNPYNTSSNGGRKLVKLSNGWLVAYAYQTNQHNIYVSKDNGGTWKRLCYVNSANVVNAGCICSYGTMVYLFSYEYGHGIACLKINALTQNDINIYGSEISIDAIQSSFSGLSADTDYAGNIYIAYSIKDTTYSSNMHYSRSSDGGCTWTIPTNVSNFNNSGYDCKNPTIVIDSTNNSHIICEFTTGSTGHYILHLTNNFTTKTLYSGNFDINWGMNVVYTIMNYNTPQLNPSAVVDNKGTIHVVWYDIDLTDNMYYNIRYANSNNNGVSWTAQKISNGNNYNQFNPSISVDKNNCIYVLWYGCDASISTSKFNVREIKYNGSSWSSVICLTKNTTGDAFNPSLCSNDNSFTEPLYIYQDNQSGSINYSGTIQTDTIYTINNLLPDTLYKILFEAKDSTGNISSITKDLYTKATVPVLSSKALSVSSIEVKTTDSNPVSTLYQIKCGDKYITSSGELTNTATWITLPNKKITISGLDIGTNYAFQAKARNIENSETEYGNIASCSTLTKISSVPQNIKLIPEENFIKLNWSTVENATGYDIEIDGNIIDNGNSTSFEGTYGPGVEHNFRVRAKNGAGPGEWSSVITGTAKFILPRIPTNIKITPAGTLINISWDVIPGATGYDLEVDGHVINIGTKATYKHSPLKLGTQYTYRVRSKNAQGVSAWSPLQTVMTTAGITGKLSNLKYTVTNTTATINWDAVTDAETYEISEIIPGQEEEITDNSNVTTCELRGLAPSSTHTYKIRAVNSMGAGEWSDPITITTFLMDTPSNIITTESDTSIVLTWNQVKDATSYVIEVNGTETIADSNSYTFKDLSPESKYTFRIKAVGSQGQSSYSDSISTTTTPIKPTIPKNVHAVVSDTTITVRWDKVDSSEGYDVELDGIVMENDNVSIYIHDGLESDTMHTYRVRARNSAIESDWSDMQYIKTLPGKPVVPKNIEIRSTTTGATLTWQGKDSDLSYDIMINDGTKNEDGTLKNILIENIAKKTYTHRRTSLGQEYTYWIRTRNKEGVSDWSGKIINNAIKAKCTKNKTVDLGLTAKDVTDFSAYTMVVTYNASAVDVIDLSTLTGQFETAAGRIEGTDIEITDFTPGKITFKCDKVVNPGEAWTGVINSIKFKARATGGTTITYTVFCRS